MRHHLVEQQQRRDTGHLRDQTGMRQHQPDQQRLLLAGGGVAGRHVLWREDHLQIGEMRTVERTACRSVARAAVAQYLPVAILN